MIEQYSFGSITISGKQYAADLKIINGLVVPDWWRSSGHIVAVDDVADILRAQPEYFIVGTGSSGLMKVDNNLVEHLSRCGIKLIAEATAKAVKIFNRIWEDGKNVSAGFHLTC